MNRVGEQQPCKSTAKKEKKKQGLNSFNSSLYLYITHAPIQVTLICSSCFELPFSKLFAALYKYIKSMYFTFHFILHFFCTFIFHIKTINNHAILLVLTIEIWMSSQDLL